MTPRAKAIAAICAASVLAFALDSCKSRSAGAAPLDIRGERVELAQAYAMLADNYAEWSDFYCPLSVSITAPRGASASGRCTMVRDSLIYISLRAMGMEAATVRLTPDSLWIIDRYNGAYLAEPLQDILGGFPLTIADMQSLILGQAFCPDSTLAPEACKATLAGGTRPALRSLSLVGLRGQQADFLYADTLSTAAGQTASAITSAILLDAFGINASLQWKFKDAKWNSGRRPAMRAPKPDYRRITPADFAI